MDRARLEMLLHDAGVGADRSVALATELMEALPAADDLSDSKVLFPGLRLHRQGLDCDWCWPAAVADADARGNLGDLCGRRVA